MTSPLSWTSPAPVDTAPPLVVRTDRRSARRWLTFVIVGNGVLAALLVPAMLWSASAIGAWGGAPSALLLFNCTFQMVFHAFHWGRLIGADQVLEVGPEGIGYHDPGRGRVDLPWSAIASVTPRWRQLLIRPVAGAGPETPGIAVEGDIPRARWRRGFATRTMAISTDVATIRAAIHHFSGGRL